MEQREVGVSEFPQLLTAVKLPVICAAIKVNGRSPELVRVTCCAALDVVIACAAKVSASGERASVAGELAVPISNAVWGPAPPVMGKGPLGRPGAEGKKT